MNSLRSSLAAVAACSVLLSTAGSALAAPKDYQITGNVVSINDTTIAIQKGKDAPWEIGRDAATKSADALKPGDYVVVHYTMKAETIEMAAAGAKGKKAEKAPKKAKADTTATAPAASGSPSKPAAEAATPTP